MSNFDTCIVHGKYFKGVGCVSCKLGTTCCDHCGDHYPKGSGHECSDTRRPSQAMQEGFQILPRATA